MTALMSLESIKSEIGVNSIGNDELRPSKAAGTVPQATPKVDLNYQKDFANYESKP